ncbi:MAG: glycosyltransferase [Hyphomicrobiales bacterium]|nr:glycosyltransferase [Hyphomicrobiales bacterium]
MSRRKLLFYTHGLVAGGAERVFARLASGFSARGDDVVFVVDYDAQANRGHLDASVDYRVLPAGHARGARALARMLAQEQPAASLSAIAVSNLKHAAAALLAGRRSRAILGYHGFYESEPERLSNIGYRLTPQIVRACAATVAVSHALRADLIDRFRAPPEKVVAIYNPAAPEPFPPALGHADLAARPPRLLAMGRLVRDKDFATLIGALALMKTRDAELVILGEGPERGALEKAVAAANLQGRVRLPGYCADTGAELDAARCFVVSSLRETFSLACVEALAHGLPAIVTDCGGPPEIVNAAALGAVVPTGDAAALARALDDALAAPGDPAARQARARDFTLETALDAYDALIERLAHGAAPGASSA